jgi:hypothetical protein
MKEPETVVDPKANGELEVVKLLSPEEKAAQVRIDAEEEKRRAAREAAFLQQLRGLVELAPPYRAGLVPRDSLYLRH